MYATPANHICLVLWIYVLGSECLFHAVPGPAYLHLFCRLAELWANCGKAGGAAWKKLFPWSSRGSRPGELLRDT